MANRFKVIINGVELEIVRDSDGKFLIPDHLRGLGSALKPAHEPICVARKPFKGTVASNVLAHKTGAINIDGCRVSTGDKLGGGKLSGSVKGGDGWNRPWMDDPDVIGKMKDDMKSRVAKAQEMGRWPANVIHDGSDEVVNGFPGKITKSSGGGNKNADKFGGGYAPAGKKTIGLGDSGSVARFFYCAKASRKDRNEGLEDPGPQFKHGATLRKIENTDTKGNTHPTVKPTDLMRYLVRLVTPPNGIVLDPFMGSGSTGKACMLEGFKFAGIDMTPEYVEISRSRIRHARKQAEPKTENLFKKGKK
jgi:hypothetical protein